MTSGCFFWGQILWGACGTCFTCLESNDTVSFWPNYNIFTNLIFPEGGVPSLATFWGEVVWGRYNLTRSLVSIMINDPLNRCLALNLYQISRTHRCRFIYLLGLLKLFPVSSSPNIYGSSWRIAMFEIILHLFLTCLIGGATLTSYQDAVQKLLAQWLSSSAELTSAIASPISGKCTVMKKRKPDKTPAIEKFEKLGALSETSLNVHGVVPFHSLHLQWWSTQQTTTASVQNILRTSNYIGSWLCDLKEQPMVLNKNLIHTSQVHESLWFWPMAFSSHAEPYHASLEQV